MRKQAQRGRAAKAERKSASQVQAPAQPKANGHAVMDSDPEGPELNARQRLFIAEYLIDLNATRAAIAAGYSENAARSIASENLTKPNIRAEIEKRLGQRLAQLEVTADNVLSRVAKFAFCDFGRFIKVDTVGRPYYDFTGATQAELDCIGELTVDEYWEGRGEDAVKLSKVKFKRIDPLAALSLLGKHRDVMAWRDSLEVKDVTERTTEEKRAELMAKMKEAAARKHKAVN